jgi:hypothetical protein
MSHQKSKSDSVDWSATNSEHEVRPRRPSLPNAGGVL